MVEAAAGGVGERIGTMTLVHDALARVRGGGLPLLAVVAALAVAASILRISVTGLPRADGLTPAQIIIHVLDAVALSVAGTAAARTLIEGGGGLRRLDRGVLECAALLTLAQLCVYGFSVVFGLAIASTKGDPVRASVVILSFLAVYLSLLVVLLRLTLWPIARLQGDRQTTPARAWRLMRRATISLVLANVLLALPLVVLGGGGILALGPSGVLSWPFQIVASVLGAGVVIASQAVNVSLYVRRVAGPATLADVFA